MQRSFAGALLIVFPSHQCSPQVVYMWAAFARPVSVASIRGARISSLLISFAGRSQLADGHSDYWALPVIK